MREAGFDGTKRDAESLRQSAEIPGRHQPGELFQGRGVWLQSRPIVVRRRDDVSDQPTWMCLICGWIYDESAGDPDHGIAPGTAWADVPMNWVCPECGARKEDFEMVRI